MVPCFNQPVSTISQPSCSVVANLFPADRPPTHCRCFQAASSRSSRRLLAQPSACVRSLATCSCIRRLPNSSFPLPCTAAGRSLCHAGLGSGQNERAHQPVGLQVRQLGDRHLCLGGPLPYQLPQYRRKERKRLIVRAAPHCLDRA